MGAYVSRTAYIGTLIQSGTIHGTSYKEQYRAIKLLRQCGNGAEENVLSTACMINNRGILGQHGGQNMVREQTKISCTALKANETGRQETQAIDRRGQWNIGTSTKKKCFKLHHENQAFSVSSISASPSSAWVLPATLPRC
jgi:hypothetical protein